HVVYDTAVERKVATPADQMGTWQNGTRATLNLVRAAADAGVGAIVHLGSSLEYGHHRRPLSEKTPLEPTTFFGAMKAATTLLWQQAARGQSLPVVILRPFSVYGPWEGYTRLIPTAIAAALSGRSLHLTTPGYRRDLVYVEDVVRACLQAAQAPHLRGEVFNISVGRQWTNEAIVRAVAAVCKVTIPVETGTYPAHESDTSYWVADCRKAARLLGWRPRISLRNGLERHLNWVREHPEYLSGGGSEGLP
ncbi:MAG: NAD(P)-dependent oxidoreductase, partial [Chloroflexi bacterium]|nr:NAD(P)-dependent oxidoreductase [Chloroflexota bacterium]